MENHKNREEFQEALSKGKGEAVRMSDTLSEKTVYSAIRLSDNSVLRVSSTQYSVFALVLQLVQPVLCIIFCNADHSRSDRVKGCFKDRGTHQ